MYSNKCTRKKLLPMLSLIYLALVQRLRKKNYLCLDVCLHYVYNAQTYTCSTAIVLLPYIPRENSKYVKEDKPTTKK